MNKFYTRLLLILVFAVLTPGCAAAPEVPTGEARARLLFLELAALPLDPPGPLTEPIQAIRPWPWYSTVYATRALNTPYGQQVLQNFTQAVHQIQDPACRASRQITDQQIADTGAHIVIMLSGYWAKAYEDLPAIYSESLLTRFVRIAGHEAPVELLRLRDDPVISALHRFSWRRMNEFIVDTGMLGTLESVHGLHRLQTMMSLPDLAGAWQRLAMPLTSADPAHAELLDYLYGRRTTPQLERFLRLLTDLQTARADEHAAWLEEIRRQPSSPPPVIPYQYTAAGKALKEICLQP